MSLQVCSLLKKISVVRNVAAGFSSFKSDLSLDKIYPQSTELKPFNPPQSEDGKFSGYIPIKELIITYVKASGPGGQHVNKRATKVDMRFHVKSATWLSEETKEKLYEKCMTKINKEGYLVVKSDKTREALTNTLDAMTKLREMIYKLEEPVEELSEETAEKLRKRKEAAIRKRLMEKRKRSLEKQSKRMLDVDHL